ncbi:hypothetical protein [Tolypothrix sp. VBCCA 56010]|uniref:hypothetical protein n=1 Tax=Tolypothrix sp. VBCCA 56010 TaxID=3137731 RepID=UPI003D7CC5AF
MKLVCNILPENGGAEANLIEFLETTSKGNILKRVKQALVQPRLCVIALACDVDELEEKQPASTPRQKYSDSLKCSQAI